MFFELLVGFIKTILIYSQISKLKKVVLFAYQRSYLQSNGNPPPDWEKLFPLIRVINFMARIDKDGLNPVYERLDPINKKLSNLMAQLENKLSEKTLLGASELLKKGIYSAAPSLYGSDDNLYSVLSCQKMFDSYMVGYLVLGNTNVISSQFINSLLQWGYILNLCRDYNYLLYPELEILMKENPKIPVVKTSKQDVPAVTLQIIGFHEARRHLIIDEIHRFRNLLDSKMNFPSFFRLLETLQIAREEIMWYFHHYDKDISGNPRFKKKEVKVLGPRLGELIWTFKMCWVDIQRNKSDIIKIIASELVADVQNALALIRDSLLDSATVSSTEKGQLKVFEAIAMASFVDLKFGDLRQCCGRILSASSSQNQPEVAIHSCLAILERIWNESLWLDKFDEMLTDRSSLKELFCFQQDLYDHLKESMERNRLESVKYLVAFGMVSHDFIDIVSSSWAFEHEFVLNDSVCYVQDVYSVLGQYTAICAHDIALATVDYQTAKREVSSAADTKKKGAKKYKKVIAGLESNLQDADPKIAQLDEDTQKFRKIMELYNVGGTSILHYEFVAFEYFLEYFGEKFRNFVNRKVFLEDIFLTKENSGVGGIDVMSFDLKRPSAFLSEIHSYLNSALYLNNITGTNVVEYLVTIWDSQVNDIKYLIVTQG